MSGTALGGLDRLLRIPVTLLHRTPTVDEDGEPGYELDTSVETLCELQQGGAHEEHEGAVGVTTWRVWLPADIPATGWDALALADGTLLELTGDPWLVRSPRTGLASHLEATVRRSH